MSSSAVIGNSANAPASAGARNAPRASIAAVIRAANPGSSSRPAQSAAPDAAGRGGAGPGGRPVGAQHPGQLGDRGPLGQRAVVGAQVVRRAGDQVPAGQLGQRDPVAGGQVTLDEAERRAVGQQHVGRALGQPERAAHRGGRARAELGQPAEQVELGHRGDQQIGRVHPVADPVERGRVGHRRIVRWRHSVARKTFLVSVNASGASGPSSRPRPEDLKPPNGVQ